MTFSEFRKKLTSPIVWGNCLGMLVALTALVVATLIFLDKYTHHDDNISIPDLTGLSQERAEEMLESLGLHMEVADTGYVRTKPAGVVLLQETLPGKEVKEGRTVRVTINSEGSPTITLPEVVDNWSLAEAKARLTAIGFRLAPVEYVTGQKGWIYNVKVRGRVVTAGAKIPVDQPITLVVGDGGTDDFDQYGEDDEELFSGDEGDDDGEINFDDEGEMNMKDRIIREIYESMQ